MLSYRHAAYAGNHADVLKHTVLSNSIVSLKLSATPVHYIDTHAGAGSYTLDFDQTNKNKYNYSIKTLDLPSLPDSITPYRNLIEPLLKKNRYPGSPLIASNLLHSQDQLHLFELHPEEYSLLKRALNKDQTIEFNNSDGYQALQLLSPSRNQQSLILIDPPYEQPHDYIKVIETLCLGARVMPDAHYLIWYPVTRRTVVNKMIQDLSLSGFSNIARYELGISTDTDDNKMTASGMIAVNPTSDLTRYMRELLPAIQQQLSPSGYFLIDKIRAT